MGADIINSIVILSAHTGASVDVFIHPTEILTAFRSSVIEFANGTGLAGSVNSKEIINTYALNTIPSLIDRAINRAFIVDSHIWSLTGTLSAYPPFVLSAY